MGGIYQSAKGVPAGGVAHHAAGPQLFTTGQLHPHRSVVLQQDLGHTRLVANCAAMALQSRYQLFCDHTNAPFGVIDAAGMTIGEHHARIDHWGEIGGHHAPAETLHVNELEQGRIAEVLPRHVAHVHW